MKASIGRKWAKSLGKFRHWWWNSAQIVQRSGRKAGRAVIQRRWIPEERVFILLLYTNLLQALKAWRAKQAQDEQVDHYRILHQRVLIQIAAMLPATPDALLHIKGMGQYTVEKYGEQLTAIVSEYCREHKITP